MRVLGVLGRCCVVTVLLFGCFASAVRAANGDLGSNGGSDGGVSGDGQVFVAVSGVQHGRGPPGQLATAQLQNLRFRLPS